MEDALLPAAHKSSPKSPGGGGSLRRLLFEFLPIFEWLPAYDVSACLQKDIACGVTLGCVLLGQSLAHANLSGVPVVHGPYSCLLPPVVYAVFGTCHQGSVGTGGLLALLTGIQLHTIEDEEVRARAAQILCLIVGVILALMGILQLSFLVRFLSRPALSGFITGSALLIMKAMVLPMLGLPKSLEKQGLRIIASDPANLELCSAGTVGLSAVCFCFLFFAKKVLPKFLADFKELIVLAGSAVFCALARMEVEVVGTAPSGLPSVTLPVTSAADVEMAKQLLPGGILIAVVTFISSFASAKKCALKGGYRVVALNELLAMGMANISGAFFGAVPVQIGLSRSALASGMGVKTLMGSNVFVAASIAGILLVFAPLLGYIPRSVLNTIIFNAAIGLFEFEQARHLYAHHDAWKDRTDLVIWVVAFCGTLILGAFEGILSAVAISLFLAIQKVVNPHINILGRRPDQDSSGAPWVSVQHFENAVQQPGVLVVRIDGPMFYANSERFQERVDEIECEFAEKDEPLRAIVLSASSISFIDDTAVQVLKEMMKSWEDRGIRFYISGAHGDARKLFKCTIFPTARQDDLQLSIDQCIALFLSETADANGVSKTKLEELRKSTTMRRQGSIRPLPSVRGFRPEKQRVSMPPSLRA